MPDEVGSLAALAPSGLPSGAGEKKIRAGREFAVDGRHRGILNTSNQTTKAKPFWKVFAPREMQEAPMSESRQSRRPAKAVKPVLLGLEELEHRLVPSASDLVISRVYAGGEPGATYNESFVVLTWC
jgi:hypothetical protein